MFPCKLDRFTHFNIWEAAMISDFAFFSHEDLRTDTGISTTHSENKPGYKIDVF